MVGIKCPNCGFFSPETAERCDCGYSFKGQGSVPTDVRIGGPSNTGILQQNVRVVDVSMPFGSMVVFMVKWAIASIPAFIILFLFGLLVAAVFGGALAGLGHLPLK